MRPYIWEIDHMSEKGGRQSFNIEDSVEASIWELKDFIKKERKTNYCMDTSSEISHKKNWTWLQKGNMKKEITSDNTKYVKRTNYLKGKNR